MRKSFKAIICAVSALVICAAPNAANYAGIASPTTTITAEAVSYVTSAEVEYDGIRYGLIGKIGDTTYSEFVALGPSESSTVFKKSSYTIPATVNYKGKVYKVTTIGEDAFFAMPYVKSVNISNADNLQSIHYGAFEGSGISSITLPKNLASIAGNAFADCKSLRNVSTQKCEKLTSIGANSFMRSGITRISIPNTVYSIAQNAFLNCSSLQSVTFSKNGRLKYICHNAFSGTALQEVTIPKTVTDIGWEAFKDCKYLYDVTFAGNNDVTLYIGSRAFIGTKPLKVINNRKNAVLGTNLGNKIVYNKYVFGKTDATNKIRAIAGNYRDPFKEFVK